MRTFRNSGLLCAAYYECTTCALINICNKKSSKLNICGDGRCDSPGDCTKYGTYTVKVENSSEILDFEVIHVAQVTSSNATEAELGCNRVL